GFSDFSVVEQNRTVYTLEATATVPESEGQRKYYGVENEHELILPAGISLGTGLTYRLPMELTTPSGKVVEAVCEMKSTDAAIEPRSYIGRAIFKFPAEDAAGTWRLRVF